MTPTDAVQLVLGIAVGVVIGILPGMAIGGYVERGGETRAKYREKKALDRYLDRFQDFSTQQLRDAIEKNRRSVIQDVVGGKAWAAEHERQTLAKMQREVNRRLAAGEVESR